ncbi:MAG: hypothetical protein HYS25_08280 [Ignavibacteriales bacterium]|nr:hypothetical protein [Ignavibacteriales bacterium]
MLYFMRAAKIFFTFLLSLYSVCFAQVNPGARSVALAHSDISFAEDPFTLFNNPACLSNINERAIGIYYSPAPFGVKELSNAFGVYAEPTEIGSFGGGFMIYGFELYKETKIALGFGRKINNKFSAGVTAVYKNLSIKNYGSRGYFLFNIGAAYSLQKNLQIGFAAENITRTSTSDDDNQFPVILSAGIGYKVIDELTAFISASKELDYNASVRFGAEYKPVDFLHLRFGTTTEPDIFSGGVGVIYNFVEADYAVTSHPDLGLTHQFGITLRFQK